MPRKLVFVSYARADEPEQPDEGVRWLTFVLGFLNAAFVGAEVDLFTDRGLAGGADWSGEIERRLRSCDAFVLLVSPHSMTSPFVVEKEIARVRAREAAGDAPLFVPILLSPTPEAALALIRDKNWRPAGDKTLWDYPPHERAQKMKEAAEEIAREVKGRERKKAPDLESHRLARSWLALQSVAVSSALAARAALRILPFYRVKSSAKNLLPNMTGALFRKNAITLASARFPTEREKLLRSALRAQNLGPTGAADGASRPAALAATAAISVFIAGDVDTAGRAHEALIEAAGPFREESKIWNAFTRIILEAKRTDRDSEFDVTDAQLSALLWAETSNDAALSSRGILELVVAPLWMGALPKPVELAWNEIRRALPAEDGWAVWFGWYDDRLRGTPRSEAYEMAFATVPEDVWEQGAKAANAWIREHLPPTSPPPDLPPPVEDAESPADFAWDEARLIEQIAGVAQAPLFEHESSPGDQAQELAAARAACDWLLKVLDARLHNVGSFYAMRVEAIRDALPISAERGAILIAYNHALTLREKLIADDGLNDEVRSDAIRIVESVFALCRFYPEVERHMVGVARMKDVDLLPTAALRGFARAVRGAPGVFAPSVVGGLGAVEALGPEGPSPAPQPAPAIPAPPQTPPADKSADRLKAGWVNALYKTFREGPAIVGATDAWIEAAHKVGEAAKPILEWLARSVGG